LGKGKFRNIATSSVGLEPKGWSGDASFSDLNGDGLPDLYVASMQGDDHYFENLGGGRFKDQTAKSFPKTPWGAMGVKFFDANQDGRIDLFLTDMHSDMTDPQIKLSKSSYEPKFEKSKSEAWCTTAWTEEYLQGSSNNIFGNALFINAGAGALADKSQEMGAETFWPWGLSAGDLNADGYEDVFITAGMGFGFRYAINSLLLNNGGKGFRDAEFSLGVEPRESNRLDKVAFVLDVSGADKDHPLSKGRSGKVPIMEATSSRSSAIVDLDGDGDLDIVTNEMNDRPQVLMSNAAEKKALHWVKIQLTGSKSNRQGLGAVVTVRAGGKVWTQQNDGKSGYLAQSAAPLYFGLGDATAIEKVEVRWPSGERQLVEKVAANLVVKITEP
jgi:enediyne biosynthesis protein E4